MAKISKVQRLRQQGKWDARMRKAFRPYAITLGELMFAWNRLHHNMSFLFDLVVKSNSKNMGLAIWYSTDSDFAQRKMLRAAVTKSTDITDIKRKDVEWVLNKIEDQLRHKRNDASHVPLAFHIRMDRADISYSVVPDTRLESPRALALMGKNLREEFKSYFVLANVLSGFVANMCEAISKPSLHAWPDRPLLPHAHQKKSRKRSSSRSIAK